MPVADAVLFGAPFISEQELERLESALEGVREIFEADAEEERAERRLRPLLAQVPRSFWGEF